MKYKKLYIIFIIILLITVTLIIKFNNKIKGESPQEKLIYEIPEPVINKIEGYDNIFIEGCHYTTENGKPHLPYLIYTHEYPKNYKIQDVKLINKTNLYIYEDINIEDFYPYSPSLPPPQKIPYEDIGWYPRIDYDYRLIENIDGSTKLVINLFPFIYNRETKQLKFYRKFEFKIEYIYSTIKINNIYLDKTTYKIDEKVKLEMEIENLDKESKDLIVLPLIKTDDGRVVDTLEMREIKNLKNKGYLSFIWDNSNKISGRFLFEVQVKDLDGKVYDSTSLNFCIGLPLIEITKFECDKANFKPGDKLNIYLEFVNNGYQKTDGEILIKISCDEGVIKEFRNNFTNLEKDQNFKIKEIWESNEAKVGKKYYINAVVYYQGMTSQNQLTITTNNPPIASFTYSPSIIFVGDLVTFNASSTFDEDNNIISYEWDFGDGWKSNLGKIVSHKYDKSGIYTVALKVRDSAEEESIKTLKIEVKEKKEEKQELIIRLYIGKTTYYVNDELKTMDVAPVIIEGRTLLPIRYVAEALGANVSWDPNEKKVIITFKDKIIELWIGNNTARVNGEYKFIDPSNPNVKPLIISGRTMLPIRFIAENLGCKVDWDPNTKTVTITYEESIND